MAIQRTELSLSFSTLEKLRAGKDCGVLQTATVMWEWVGRGFYLLCSLLFSVGLTRFTRSTEWKEIMDEDLMSLGQPHYREWRHRQLITNMRTCTKIHARICRAIPWEVAEQKWSSSTAQEQETQLISSKACIRSLPPHVKPISCS